MPSLGGGGGLWSTRHSTATGAPTRLLITRTTSITRWRFVFAWAGGLLMLTLAFGVFLVPSERYPVGQLNLDGYQLYGWTGAAAWTTP